MRIRSNTYQKVCHLIASNIRDLVKTHTNPVLGLATGTTPIGIYQELSKMKTDSGLEEYAREKLYMKKEDEEIFIIEFDSLN